MGQTSRVGRITDDRAQAMLDRGRLVQRHDVGAQCHCLLEQFRAAPVQPVDQNDVVAVDRVDPLDLGMAYVLANYTELIEVALGE